jgi:hypothetical protein
MMTKFKPIVYAIAGLALLFLGGMIRDWYRPPPPGPKPVPTVAKETSDIAKAEKQTVERRIQIPTLPPKTQARIERDFSLDLDATSLLTKVETPPAPHGGEAVVTLSPEGATTVTFLPKPEPFFDLGGDWEIAAGPLYKNGELGARVRISRDLARLGKLRFRGEVGVDVGRETDVNAALLGVVRF